MATVAIIIVNMSVITGFLMPVNWAQSQCSALMAPSRRSGTEIAAPSRKFRIPIPMARATAPPRVVAGKSAASAIRFFRNLIQSR
jgi:hypothetical protein